MFCLIQNNRCCSLTSCSLFLKFVSKIFWFQTYRFFLSSSPKCIPVECSRKSLKTLWCLFMIVIVMGEISHTHSCIQTRPTTTHTETIHWMHGWGYKRSFTLNPLSDCLWKLVIAVMLWLVSFLVMSGGSSSYIKRSHSWWGFFLF